MGQNPIKCSVHGGVHAPPHYHAERLIDVESARRAVTEVHPSLRGVRGVE